MNLLTCGLIKNVSHSLGDMCQQQQVPKTPANEEVFVNVPEFSVPKPGTILGVQISCVINPYNFYVIFPDDHEKGDGSMEGCLKSTENMEKLQVCGVCVNVNYTFVSFQLFIRTTYRRSTRKTTCCSSFVRFPICIRLWCSRVKWTESGTAVG